MKCPAGCDAELRIAERQGIEIDYCPTCRGVWLNRGELDKIIEKAVQQELAMASPPPPASRTGAPPIPEAPRRDNFFDDDDYERYPRRRRRGFLYELFDFD